MATRIEIDISQQTLALYEDADLLEEYAISTAKNGISQEMGSECTPLGCHRIAEKIGAGAAVGGVFVSRRLTGEVYSPELRRRHPERDWILTRILWLAGAEPGKNQGGRVDSFMRYIYIHGTPDENSMGQPGSRGCIRMDNIGIVELFDRVEVGDAVEIFLSKRS
ncbi:MAG: L,D-transpeptidase family protein [Candidatus Eutrophobiaceae bacterium]